MHIFFDLDDTLWDFSRNTHDTLGEMFLHFNFTEIFNPENTLPLTQKNFQNAFPIVNEILWDNLSKKLIDANTLRNIRFQEVLKYLGHDISLEFSKKLSDFYMEHSPTKPHLVDGAWELLENLKQKGHKIHIITNGFENIQHQKIKSAGIGHFFTHIITSEQTNVKKPDSKMYHYACALVEELPQNCMMIGDHWENDVEGALQVGMKTLFFNPSKKIVLNQETHISPQIHFLSEIVNFI